MDWAILCGCPSISPARLLQVTISTALSRSRLLTAILILSLIMISVPFSQLPQWLRGKESACNTGTAGDAGVIPGSERSRRGGHTNPLQYSCLENPMVRGSLWATVQSKLLRAFEELISLTPQGPCQGVKSCSLWDVSLPINSPLTNPVLPPHLHPHLIQPPMYTLPTLGTTCWPGTAAPSPPPESTSLLWSGDAVT